MPSLAVLGRRSPRRWVSSSAGFSLLQFHGWSWSEDPRCVITVNRALPTTLVVSRYLHFFLFFNNSLLVGTVGPSQARRKPPCSDLGCITSCHQKVVQIAVVGTYKLRGDLGGTALGWFWRNERGWFTQRFYNTRDGHKNHCRFGLNYLPCVASLGSFQLLLTPASLRRCRTSRQLLARRSTLQGPSLRLSVAKCEDSI